MYSVHVNMMTLFISEPQRAVRHLANTQDKVQNVVPESEECQRPLCFLSVQSYRQCTYSMFVVLIKNFFFTILLFVILETKTIVVNTWTWVITILSISKSIPGFFLIIYAIVVSPVVIVAIIIIEASTGVSMFSQRQRWIKVMEEHFM